MDHLVTVSTPKIMPPKKTERHALSLAAALQEPFRYPRIAALHEEMFAKRMMRDIPKELRKKKTPIAKLKGSKKQCDRILSVCADWATIEEVSNQLGVTTKSARDYTKRMLNDGKLDRRRTPDRDASAYQYKVGTGIDECPAKRMSKRDRAEIILKHLREIDDWITSAEFSKQTNMSWNACRHVMADLKKEGKVEQRREYTGEGSFSYWRIKKSKNEIGQERRQMIVDMCSDWVSSKEVAERLGLNINTVRAHLQHLLLYGIIEKSGLSILTRYRVVDKDAQQK